MIGPQNFRGIPVYLVPHLEWELWRMADRIITGRERWFQLVFTCLVQSTILETDPGPLDARVP